MSSYTNIFGGSPVQPSEVSYLALTLPGDLTLSWPTQFQDTNNVVSHIIDVTSLDNGYVLTLPDATQVSVGQDILINNPGENSFVLNRNDGTLLANIDPGNILYFYLINNTTAAGTWRTIPFGGGVAAVTSVDADVPASPDSENLTIIGGPITSAGTLHFSFAGDLEALINFGGATGIAVRTDVDSWELRSIVPVANGNVVINNGTGVDGNISIDLAQNIGIPPSNPVNTMQVGNILLEANVISSTNVNGNINLNPNGDGTVNSSNNFNVMNGSSLSFYNDDNSQFISFSGSLVAGANVPLAWPADPPVDGQVLQFIGAGALTWANVTTFFGPDSTDTAIARFHGTAGQLQNSGVLIDGLNNLTTPAELNAGTSINIGTFSISPENVLSTSAGVLTLQPVAGSSLSITSDTFIGTTAVGGSKTLFFPYLGFTVSLTPPVLVGDVPLTLPATLPVNNNSIFQASTAGILSFSPLFLSAGAPAANNSIMQGATTGALTFSALTTTVADAATMAAATSVINPVVPLNFQYHPGVVKSWAIFAGTTAIIDQSYNVAGIVRNSAGNYTVTFTTPFAFATYAANVSCSTMGGAPIISNFGARNANTIVILCFSTINLAVDPDFVSFCAEGGQ